MPCQNHPQIDEGLSLCTSCRGLFCADCIVGLGGTLRCGPCKTEWVLDRLSGLPTTLLDYASIWRRFLALMIDNLLIGLPSWLVILILASAGTTTKSTGALGTLAELGPLFISLLTIPLAFVYQGWMIAARGQTLGKMALNIGIVTPEGDRLKPGQAWGRAALQQVFLSCLSFLDVIPALLTPERTCIHDMAAKTRVINWPR